MNYYAKYVFVLLLLMIVGFVFEKYKRADELNDKVGEYDLIKKYLLNDSTLARTDKPILWIHVAFETNARWWPHFSSRNTECFNQPYQYLTIKSIVDHCGESFNVCLLDDKSFKQNHSWMGYQSSQFAQSTTSSFKRIGHGQGIILLWWDDHSILLYMYKKSDITL